MHSILVVEDDEPVREYIAAHLTDWGYDVRQCENGLAAIEAARAMRPDLIMMDIGLPGITGFEAIRRIKTDPATADAVIVALTAHDSVEDRDEAYAAGIDAFLTKPILDVDVVKTTIARLLS